MFSLFFTEAPVYDWQSVKASDIDRFARFFRAMLARGIYLAPSQFEAGFVSTAHRPEDIQDTVAAALDAFKTL
jgi:glutamate-1-semialdehyde 2,1-aminomutase